MSGAGTVVEIAYGEGWDLAARTLLGPLTLEAARARTGRRSATGRCSARRRGD